MLQSILGYVLIMGAMNNVLQIIRVWSDVGQIIKLISAVLTDIAAYFVFFFMIVLVFSFLHQVLGNAIDENDYYEVNPSLVRYFLHTWILSTGGGHQVRHEVWANLLGEDNPNDYRGHVMNAITWSHMLLNKILVNLVLMRFLIGHIFRSFSNQMQSVVENSYEQRAEMNQVCSLVMHFLGLNYETDLIVLSADYKPKQTVSEVTVLKTELEERCGACQTEQACFKAEYNADMQQLKELAAEYASLKKSN